jgi:peptidoglycan/LPS O-acetylase OafA/YrhL
MDVPAPAPASTEADPTTPFAERIAALTPRLPTDRATYPLGYIRALDGLRGFLIIGTLSAHTMLSTSTNVTVYGGVAVYVDIFFAISGYLITSLLIADYRKRGKISLKRFYTRRFMRLYPPVVLAVVVVVLACWLFSAQFKARLTEAIITFVYLTDYWFALYFPRGYNFQQTWSLAVEEQFYVLWPLTFIVLLRRWELSWKTAAAILVMAAGFTAWRVGLTYGGMPTRWLFFAFDTRADSLLVGCGLAVILKLVDLGDYPRVARLLALSLAPIFLFEVASGIYLDPRLRWYFYVSPLFGAIPGIICIAALVQPRRTFMHRVYEHPVPAYLGRTCYGLYLYHLPVFRWVQQWAPPNNLSLTIFLVGWPLTLAAASASYFFVERNFMRARPAA